MRFGFWKKFQGPKNIFGKVIKRIFDIIFSIVGLLFFIIFLPFVALAMKLDSEGHVFYSQKRVGKMAKYFLIHKFRTMKE